MEVSINKVSYKALNQFSRAYANGAHNVCLILWDKFHKEWYKTISNSTKIVIETIMQELDPPAPISR